MATSFMLDGAGQAYYSSLTVIRFAQETLGAEAQMSSIALVNNNRSNLGLATGETYAGRDRVKRAGHVDVDEVLGGSCAISGLWRAPACTTASTPWSENKRSTTVLSATEPMTLASAPGATSRPITR